VVIVTPIFPDSFDSTSAVLLVPTESRSLLDCTGAADAAEWSSPLPFWSLAGCGDLAGRLTEVEDVVVVLVEFVEVADKVGAGPFAAKRIHD